MFIHLSFSVSLSVRVWQLLNNDATADWKIHPAALFPTENKKKKKIK